MSSRLFDWGIARARIGIAQVDVGGLLPLELNARFPDARLAAWPAAARPTIDVRLGVDLTAVFAAAPASPYTPRP